MIFRSTTSGWSRASRILTGSEPCEVRPPRRRDVGPLARPFSTVPRLEANEEAFFVAPLHRRVVRVIGDWPNPRGRSASRRWGALADRVVLADRLGPCAPAPMNGSRVDAPHLSSTLVPVHQFSEKHTLGHPRRPVGAATQSMQACAYAMVSCACTRWRRPHWQVTSMSTGGQTEAPSLPTCGRVSLRFSGEGGDIPEL